MRRGSEPTFTTRVNLLLAVFSSPGICAAAISSVFAPAPPTSNIKVSVCRLPSAPSVTLRDASTLGCAVVASRTVRLIFEPAYPRWCKVILAASRDSASARGSDHDVIQLHIMFGVLASEAHGVNRNVAGAQRADGIGADASGVIVAVAEQHHRADGQIGGLLDQLLEAVADAGGGRGGLQILEIVDAGGRASTRYRRV